MFINKCLKLLKVKYWLESKLIALRQRVSRYLTGIVMRETRQDLKEWVKPQLFSIVFLPEKRALKAFLHPFRKVFVPS